MKRGGKLAILLATFACAACGYAAVYGGEPPSGRLAVVVAPVRVADTEAAHEAAAGARHELGRAQALAPGDRYPRLVVDVLRVDELGTGIAGRDQPNARGIAVGVLGRAWVERSPGGPPESDTGDVRRSARVVGAPEAGPDSRAYRQALRAAARELGRALGRRVLGQPEPGVEPL